MHLPPLVLIDEVLVIHVSGFSCCSLVVLLFMCRGFPVTPLILLLTYMVFCALVKAQCTHHHLLSVYLMYKRLLIRVFFAHLCLPL